MIAIDCPLPFAHRVKKRQTERSGGGGGEEVGGKPSQCTGANFANLRDKRKTHFEERTECLSGKGW